MTELAKLIPIKDFMDHGPNARWPGVGADLNGVKFAQEVYPTLYAKGTHTVVKVGDKLPLEGIDVRAIASNGEFLKAPLKGGGQTNPKGAGARASPARGRRERRHPQGR